MSLPGYTRKQAEKIKGQIDTDVAGIEARMAWLGRRVTDHSVDGGPGYFGARLLEDVREHARALHEIVDRRTR